LMLQFADNLGKRSDGFYGFRISGSPGRFGPVQWMKTSPFPPGTGGNTRASLEGGSRGGADGNPGPALARQAIATNFAAPPPLPRTLPAPAAAEAAPAPAPPATPSSAASEAQAEPGGLPPNANVPRYATSPPRE
jgi:hypothetical protein